MKTVFVLVDALKSLYLTQENMPFLYSLSQKGLYVKQIIPCAGYCERSEIFSGLDGYDTGNFTAIGYLPEESPYKNDGFILWLAELCDNIYSKGARKLFQIWRKKNKRRLNPYKIPIKSLRCFALTEDGQKQLKPHSDIFDRLKESGLTYTLDGFTALSDFGKRTNLAPVNFVASKIKQDIDFIPVYIGIIDSVGHHYGECIESIRPYLLNVDTQLKSIYENAIQSGYAFCVLGDHGMIPVTKKIDIISAIKLTGCKLHKDYEAFYDSTLVRFWFNNENAKNKIIDCLTLHFSKDGFVVDKNNSRQHRIPLDVYAKDGRPVYGDLVWCANPSVLISPDYFHSSEESEKGMHGYIEVVEGHGTGLYVNYYDGINPKEIDKAASSTVCENLCELLGVSKPN